MNDVTVQVGQEAGAWFTAFTTLLGAVIGALAAGLVSFLLTKATQREIDRASGHLLLVKFSTLFSALGSIHLQVQKQLRDHRLEHEAEENLWQRLLPITGLESRHVFSANDLSILFKIKEYDLANDLVTLDERSFSLAKAIETYIHARKQFAREFGGAMEGRVGETKISDEKRAVAGPMIVELQDLASAIVRNSREFFNDGQALMPKLSTALRGHFGKKNFPAIGIHPDINERLNEGEPLRINLPGSTPVQPSSPRP